MNKYLKWVAGLALLASLNGSEIAHGQNILHSGAGGDIFFLYKSQLDRWHSVFRAKGTTGQPTTTIASGLTNPFPSFTGVSGANTVLVPAVNGHTGDYTFDNLIVAINTTTMVDVGGTDYYIATASGSPLLNDGSTPDLGIRVRLREDEVALGIGSNTASNQFDNFRMTLNLANSTFNGNPMNQSGSPHVSILHWDAFNNPIALIDTAAAVNSVDLDVWGHIHRNWGFSEYGNYALSFDISGVGGEYGATASSDSVTLNFGVIPEPSTLGLMLLVMGLGAAFRSARIRRVAG